MTHFVLGVVAHESRRETAFALQHEQGAVAWNVDDGNLGCEQNHLVVLTALAAVADKLGSDWCVVLEDDALPVNNFRTHAATALDYAPAPVVGFYLGTGNPSYGVQREIGVAVRAAQDKGCAWLVGDCLIGSVGYAVRASLLTWMVEEISEHGEELPLRISRWVQAAGLQVAYTMPSLVEHDDREPINIPYATEWERDAARRNPRTAWYYGERERWDTPVVTLGYCPGWSKEH